MYLTADVPQGQGIFDIARKQVERLRGSACACFNKRGENPQSRN